MCLTMTCLIREKGIQEAQNQRILLHLLAQQHRDQARIRGGGGADRVPIYLIKYHLNTIKYTVWSIIMPQTGKHFPLSNELPLWRKYYYYTLWQGKICLKIIALQFSLPSSNCETSLPLMYKYFANQLQF